MNRFITPREEDYSKWYNDIVVQAGLADHSSVRGCMVIKPYGFAIWEKMQGVLDRMFKDTGHVNAYFPLFIPKSLFEAEEKNAEGFAKECAVVTHYRLKNHPTEKGRLIVDPEARLEEELVVRPTSEAIIWNTYKNWIQSYRDLPILVNQWANVVRWEMRTRLFLRTAEFLWQEGHTAHASKEEAMEEAKRMLEVYADFAENYMAMPVVRGVKTPGERFAGADETFCIEALMQDGKALQAGTSHFLGQNFARAFDVTFADKNGKMEYVWATSWGVSTRLMGALIMTHSDNNGLVLPPRLAPLQVVLIPIYKGTEGLNQICQTLHPLMQAFKEKNISCRLDDRDTERPGYKFAHYELQGVPVRLALGERDLQNGTIELARRDTMEKVTIPLEQAIPVVEQTLQAIQQNLLEKARIRMQKMSYTTDNYEEFKKILDEKGGFIYAHWDGTSETEEKIKEETKATIRCIPLDNTSEKGTCIYSGKPSEQRVIFARAY